MKSSKKSKFAILALCFAFLLISTTSAFASPMLKMGQTIRYSSDSCGDATLFAGAGMLGCCGEPGKPADSSGEGRVTAIFNKDTTGRGQLCRKALYLYGEKKRNSDGDPWLQDASRDSSINGMQRSNFSERVIQYALTRSNSAISDYDETSQKKIKDAVEALDDVTVPNKFVAYFVTTPGDVQSFLLFQNDADITGPVKLKKVSANTGITG